MATSKKPKKEKARSKRPVGKKAAPAKKAAVRKLAMKRVMHNKKSAKKMVAPRKAPVKKRTHRKGPTGRERSRVITVQVRGASQSVDAVAFPPEPREARPGELTGDLQGLSNLEGANSESVDELLEEGNAFEAEAVQGVEDADDADESEVHTHELPEDDVPDEYLNGDK
jgi:hypothetical protein